MNKYQIMQLTVEISNPASATKGAKFESLGVLLDQSQECLDKKDADREANIDEKLQEKVREFFALAEYDSDSDEEDF